MLPGREVMAAVTGVVGEVGVGMVAVVTVAIAQDLDMDPDDPPNM